MDINEVAQRSGVPASTLRFYEEKRLIKSVGRRGLRRVFHPGVLERLALIALGRGAIWSVLPFDATWAPPHPERSGPEARKCHDAVAAAR